MTRTSSRLVALCAIALALAAASPRVLAGPSTADIATAKSLVVEGRELREKGDHRGARDRFKAAWSLVASPIVGLDLAREHLALGELIEAREIAVEVTKLTVSTKESNEGKAARVEAAKLASELADRIPSLVITVDGLTEDSSVLLDGASIPVATLGTPRKVNPGTHRITVRRGDRNQVKKIVIAEGERKVVRLEGPAETSTSAKAPEDTPTEASTTNPLVYWGLGTTLVGLGVATVAYYKHSALKDYINGPACRDPQACGDQQQEQAVWRGTFNWIGIPVTLAGVGITIYGFAKPGTSSPANKATSVRGMTVALTGTSILVQGAF